MNPPRVYMCSQSWTPLPPPSPYHPSRSSQCTSPKHPVSCIKPGLAIHFLDDIICVSMPFSQIIPPNTHTQSPEDCSIHLCLFCCLTYRVIIIEELMNRWYVENQSSIVFFCEESVDLYYILSIYIWFASQLKYEQLLQYWNIQCTGICSFDKSHCWQWSHAGKIWFLLKMD